MTDKTPKIKAEELLKKLLEGKELHDSFANSIEKQLLISGHSMEYWKERFKITIPSDDLTPGRCKQIDLELMDLHQEAYFYKAVAEIHVQMIKRGTDSQIQGRMAALVEEYKGKRVAAAKMEATAKFENDDFESALSIANLELRFWKDILEHLAACRKLLENATLNISVELKALSQEGLIDALGRRANQG